MEEEGELRLQTLSEHMVLERKEASVMPLGVWRESPAVCQ